MKPRIPDIHSRVSGTKPHGARLGNNINIFEAPLPTNPEELKSRIEELRKDVQCFISEQLELAIVVNPFEGGTLANLGKPGASNSFGAIMSTLANVPHDDSRKDHFDASQGMVDARQLLFLESDNTEMNAHVTAAQGSALKDRPKANKLSALAMEMKDQTVPLLRALIEAELLTVEIGSDDSMILAAIEAAFQANDNKPVDLVHIDPHSDTRKYNGRYTTGQQVERLHSGNGITLAMRHGMLRRVLMFGLNMGKNDKENKEFLHKHREITWKPFSQAAIDSHGLRSARRKLGRALDEGRGTALILNGDTDTIQGLRREVVSAPPAAGTGLELKDFARVVSDVVDSRREDLKIVRFPELIVPDPEDAEQKKVVGEVAWHLIHTVLMSMRENS